MSCQMCECYLTDYNFPHLLFYSKSYESKSFFSLTQNDCPEGGSFLLFLSWYSISGIKKSKSLNKYMKEKGKEREAFSKLNFNLVIRTVNP